MQTSRFISQSLFAVTLAIILYAVIQRLFIGVDLTDESFYVVVAKSMIDWGPFGASASMAQLSSWVLIMPIQLWYAVGMGERGLILCLRITYLVTLVACCSVLYPFVRKRLGYGAAALFSLTPLTWIPLGIPALSYDTIAEEGFLCALLLFSFESRLNVRDIRIWIANCLLAIACLSYPTLSFACVLFFVLRFTLDPDPATRKASSLSLFSLITMGALFLAFFVYSCGTKALAFSLSISNTMTTVSRAHFGEILSAELTTGNVGFFCCQSMLAGLAALISKDKWVRFIVELIFLGGLVTVASEQVVLRCNSHALISMTCMFLIPWLSLSRGIPTSSKAAFFASIFAGLIFSLTSGCAALNFCIGAFPAFCIGLAEFLAENLRFSMLERVGAILITATSVVTVLISSANTMYGDTDADKRSSAFMRVGPYAWLRTTPEKKMFLRYLTDDLHSLKGKQTIYVIGPPGCYLCTNMKPLDPTTFHWACANGLELLGPQLKDFFRLHGLPDVVLQMKEGAFSDAAFSAAFSVTTSFEKELMEHHYVLKIDRPAYRVFVSKESMAGESNREH